MKISDRALAEIKGKIDILDIISEHVTLKNNGKEHTGLCPFHDEKSPSFSVNPDKGVFFCFGCGEKGDAITFLINHTRQTFVEVMTDLGNRYGVELGETQADVELWRKEQKLKHSLNEINETACKFYQSKLDTKALNYLSDRSITQASIDQFRLGYAPDEWNDLLNFLLEKYEYELVLKSGLITKKGDSIYNSFRDRLMMPIFDPQGEVIGFSGRALGDSKPKYLNSPETVLFKKSEILYPFHLARKAINKADFAVVVEGNFDVIKLHQEGIANVVASLGTSFSNKQLNKLVRQTRDNNLILAFDNDNAGTKAIRKVIGENIKAIDQNLINVKVLDLPDPFKDVDEIINTPNGRQVIRQLFTECLLWVDWEIKKITSTYDLENPIEFNNCSKDFTQLLSKISDPNLKTFYVDKCGSILAKDNQQLKQEHVKALKLTLRLVNKTSNQISNQGVNNQTSAKKQVGQGIDIFLGLSPEEIKGLSCELLLAKIALFCPEHKYKVISHLSTLNWFIKDPVSRWVINQISSTLDEAYLVSKLKSQLRTIFNDREVFESAAEFLNSDYLNQLNMLKEKGNRIFSQTQSSLLTIENPEQQIAEIYIALQKLQIENKIKVLQLFLENTTNKEEQISYLKEIGKLRQLSL